MGLSDCSAIDCPAETLNNNKPTFDIMYLAKSVIFDVMEKMQLFVFGLALKNYLKWRGGQSVFLKIINL